ncbi:MAG: hypothetical protein OSA99_20070 [Acidimicrobiales bacterium]|nr:hypothetical protein [Acidimicrobiales bacterium]
MFGDDAFAEANPVSQAMTGIVAVLDQHNLDTETDKLDGFYASIRRRVEGIHPDDGEARQRIIKDLYGRFFKIAFPKVADSLGIVYTPIEVVDFILRAIEAALAEHFDGASLSDEGVHVLDPFTGTGTFMTRLLQSGFIRPEDLERKFTEELHANEVLLLAYYIAAVNIEATYRQERARNEGLDPGYTPFPGVVLTDTFQLGETGDGTGVWDVFPINNERAARQKGLDIRVILGNPPYSVGQESANDDNQNLKYPNLDASIAETYAERSSSVNMRTLYDSYVRAIRWASNRLLGSPHGGVVAFVTNGGYIDSASLDGLRRVLADEFHHLYVFNLRGNQRTAGEVSRREGGKIFDSGSRAGVAIMLLVKRPAPVPAAGAVLHYLDIGDYVSRDDKLAALAAALPPPELCDGAGLSALGWTAITPNKHGDWINQRSDSFEAHMSIADAKKPSVFHLRSLGAVTSRDAWNYNSSRSVLDHNATRMIENYNAEADSFFSENPSLTGTLAQKAAVVRASVDYDPTRFSWDRSALQNVAKGVRLSSSDRLATQAMYRPFHPRWMEAGQRLNRDLSQLSSAFDLGDPDSSTLAIVVPTAGARSAFSVLMVSQMPDYHFWPDGTVCIPCARRIAPTRSSDPQLFGDDSGSMGHESNVTDHVLAAYRSLDETIVKDDVFFYVYGILHSPDYRLAFEADLKKSLPRIPQVLTAEDFWAFEEAGRKLAELHAGYEAVEPWPDLRYNLAPGFDAEHPDAHRVLKMKHPRITDTATGKKVEDRTRIIYNEWITIDGIPERAYEYELGSRTAIAWAMDAWRVRTDKASGIVNDPNDWASEHDEPTYILDLVGRVVAVSMRTLEIIDELPVLDL